MRATTTPRIGSRTRCRRSPPRCAEPSSPSHTCLCALGAPLARNTHAHETVDSRARQLEVPTLDGFGVDENTFRKAVPMMAEAALASGSPDKNPVIPDKKQVEALYHQIWDEGVQRGAAPTAA